jgi:hypothetical protein
MPGANRTLKAIALMTIAPGAQPMFIVSAATRKGARIGRGQGEDRSDPQVFFGKRSGDDGPPPSRSLELESAMVALHEFCGRDEWGGPAGRGVDL